MSAWVRVGQVVKDGYSRQVGVIVAVRGRLVTLAPVRGRGEQWTTQRRFLRRLGLLHQARLRVIGARRRGGRR